MKLRLLLSTVFGVVAVAFLIGAAKQRRHLDQLRARTPEAVPAASIVVAPASDSAVTTGAPLTEDEKVERMRLRREVGELTRRQRELTAVSVENTRLKQQLAVARTNAAPVFPPGYIKAADAKFAGLATPESAVESFVWAIHHRDRDVLAQVLTEEAAQGMLRELQQEGDGGFDKMASMLVGFRVIDQSDEGDNIQVLKIEIIPGVDPIPFHFKRVGDAWRMSP